MNTTTLYPGNYVILLEPNQLYFKNAAHLLNWGKSDGKYLGQTFSWFTSHPTERGWRRTIFLEFVGEWEQLNPPYRWIEWSGFQIALDRVRLETCVEFADLLIRAWLKRPEQTERDFLTGLVNQYNSNLGISDPKFALAVCKSLRKSLGGR